VLSGLLDEKDHCLVTTLHLGRHCHRALAKLSAGSVLDMAAGTASRGRYEEGSAGYIHDALLDISRFCTGG